MCGIAGIFAYGDGAPAVDGAELLRIREYMASRGPDGAGEWLSVDGGIGLAHRRLSIIDLSASACQPMATPDSRFRISFNGEIYNFRELRRELEAKGTAFHTSSDTEVLLALYAERGAAMLPILRGMFALVIWDERERTLFLARDPFGIKPLYYADGGGTLRFASQVKALMAGGALRASQDAAGWAGFFVWGAVPEPFTIFQQVRSLPAGHWMALRQFGQPEIRRYFSVAEEIGSARAAAPAPSEMRHSLEESVRYHLVADVPVGMFLSAGVDSSLIAHLAARRNPELRTITLGFEEFRGGPQDETTQAEALARQLGTRHSTHWIGADEFDAVRVRFLQAMDQPTIDGLNVYLVSRIAAEAGMKVALSGLGGDEFFGGYPSFRQVPALARVLGWSARLPRIGRAFRRLTAAAFQYGGAPKYAGLLEYGATIPGAYLLRRAVFMPWELPQLMGHEAAAAGMRKLGSVTPALECSAVGGDWAKICMLESSCYMKNMLLRDADWAGMTHGVEIRVPLVDVGVFNVVARGIAAQHPLTKMDLQAAGAPGSRAPQHKRGFAVPMRGWLTGNVAAAAGGRGSRLWAAQVARSLGWNPPDLRIAA